MEQDTTEQVHRGNFLSTPCFLALQEAAPVSTTGSAGLPKGSLVGVGIASHLPCMLCRIEYRQPAFCA